MTKEEFQKLSDNIILLDGATGSNLMAAGMPGAPVRNPGYLSTKKYYRICRKLM